MLILPRLNSRQAINKFSIEITFSKIWFPLTPPPAGIRADDIRASVVHKIVGLYKIIYLNNKKLNKADKLGVRAKTEQICLNCLHFAVAAALLSTNQKLPLAEKLRIEIEMLKQIIRLEMEIETIDDKIYILWQENLQEISKMTTGWIKYLQKKEPD